MQQDNQQPTASIHELPSNRQPAERPASSELPAASEGEAAAANGTKRASVFAPAWNRLRSAGWMKRIADFPAVRAFVSTVKKALDDTQADSQRNDKKWQ
jgi:hypothetical protein